MTKYIWIDCFFYGFYLPEDYITTLSIPQRNDSGTLDKKIHTQKKPLKKSTTHENLKAYDIDIDITNDESEYWYSEYWYSFVQKKMKSFLISIIGN